MFAPKEDQIEGMKFILSKISLKTYLTGLSNLVTNGYLSKSLKHKYIKDARHLLGISYADLKKIAL